MFLQPETTLSFDASCCKESQVHCQMGGSHMYPIVKECKPCSYKKNLDVSGSQEASYTPKSSIAIMNIQEILINSKVH